MINRLNLVPLILFLFFGLILAAVLSPVITDYQQLRELKIPKNNDLSVLWSIKLHDRIINSPQVSDEMIYVQTLSEMIAIDQSKKEVIWKQKIKGDDSNCAFVIHEDMIFTPSEYGVLYAINRRNGQILWSLPQLPYEEKFEDITVQNGLIYFATYNGYLQVRNTKNGDLIWQLQTPQRSQIKLQIIDKTLLMSATGKLFAYNALNGNQLWERSIDIGELFYWKEKNLVIIYEWRHDLYWISALDKANGQTDWTTEIAMSEVNCISAVGDQLLISGNGMAKFDWENKKFLWMNKKLDHLACPVILKNMVVVRKMDRDFYFFDFSSGNLFSRYPLRWTIFTNFNQLKEPNTMGNRIILSITGREISCLLYNEK
jgi:outer membrane protein assembly factor BamB